MLSLAIVLIACVFVVAAVMDLRDRRRGRSHRAAMATERRDMAADFAATQHRGICIPIDDICRDRQRNR
jgi:hypothetical protein